MSKDKKMKQKKSKLKLGKPNFRFPRAFKGSLSHVLTIASMLPLLVAIWIAFPTFEFSYKGKQYEVSGYQPVVTETYNYERLGFNESLDLQGGMTFKLELPPKTTTPTPTATVTPTPKASPKPTAKPTGTVAPTATPTIAVGPLSETELATETDKTINIIRERLDALKPVTNQMFRLDNEDKTQILINLSKTREEASLIPYYLSLKGEMTLWVDDPTFVPKDEEGSEQFINPFEGRTVVDVTENDLSIVEAIDDQLTQGPGLKVVFNNNVTDKLLEAASKIGTNPNNDPLGFMLVIDGQPVGIQSAPFTQSTKSSQSIYFTLFGTDIDSFKAIAATMNTDLLPLDVSVVSESNSNLGAQMETNLSKFKLALFIGFVVANIALIYMFKSFSIFNVMMNVNTLVLSIAILKLFRQSISTDLIIGVFAGLLFITFVGILLSRTMLSNVKQNSVDFVENKRKEISSRAIQFGFLLLFATMLLYGLGNVYTYQFAWGLGATVIAAIITIYTIYITFVNELFLLPLKQHGKKA